MDKAKANQAVISTFHENIHTGVMSITFSRRDIIEGYMTGKLPFDRLVSNMDLHSGYSGLKVEIFKKDGVVTHARETFIKSPQKERHVLTGIPYRRS